MTNTDKAENLGKIQIILELLKLLIRAITVFLWIPSLLLFGVGCFGILPAALKPLLHEDEFKAGELYVDSTASFAKSQKRIMYSYGHIQNQNNKKVHYLQVDYSDINLSDCRAGKIVPVYFHIDLEKVYLRKKHESIQNMPTSKVRNPFIFWCGLTMIPFPLFSFINIRHWIRTRREKKERKNKALESEKWIGYD